MAEARPACEVGAAAITVAVKGATFMDTPKRGR